MPILAYANYTEPFKYCTQMPVKMVLALGAVLYQRQDDNMECVIAYASRTLSKPKRNYDTHKLELCSR